MGDFRIHCLGCSSAKPNAVHNPSSTVVQYGGNLYMVDCGEGAQQQMQRQHLPFSRLGHIFLTHLHGDHVFGLPGLVGTLALTGVGGTLTIHTFADGERIFRTLFDYFNRDMPINIKFNLLNPRSEEVVFENRTFRIRTLPLKHRVPCVGYIFEEREKPRHLRADALERYNIPISQRNNIKGGADFITPEGDVISNALLTTAPSPSRRYVHLGDTMFVPGNAEKVKGADLLYHETTYLESEKKDASKRGHSTALQAATFAKMAEVKQLLTGHYSSRYRNDNLFLEEAKAVFENTILGTEGVCIDL